MRSIVLLALFAASSSATAQIVDRSTPRGEVRVAPVGGVIWEHSKFTGAPGVVIEQPVQANWGALESVNLPAGATLMIIREKKLKACAERIVTRAGGFAFGGWNDCLIDADQNGYFDRVAFNEVGGSKEIVPPIKYSRALVPVEGVGSASFKRIVTYLGKSAGDIRLSYREFSNDMARPAFTEDLTLPVPESFPQTMQVKEITLTVLGIGSSGLTYRID